MFSFDLTLLVTTSHPIVAKKQWCSMRQHNSTNTPNIPTYSLDVLFWCALLKIWIIELSLSLRQLCWDISSCEESSEKCKRGNALNFREVKQATAVGNSTPKFQFFLTCFQRAAAWWWRIWQVIPNQKLCLKKYTPIKFGHLFEKSQELVSNPKHF